MQINKVFALHVQCMRNLRIPNKRTYQAVHIYTHMKCSPDTVNTWECFGI